jgi:nucleoside-diphosphate-sugar epimerase
MRIFITGSDGFIGSAMRERLGHKHHLGFLTEDLRDHQAVRDQVIGFNPEIIVHLAARTEVEDSFYEQVTFSDINYTGSVNLIEAATACPDLINFVFASTMEVYGWSPESDLIKHGKDNLSTFKLPVFTPKTIPHPNAPYSVAKRGVELYLEYAQRSLGLNSTVIRQTNAYGRKSNDFFVTEQIINQMLHNPSEINLGYGEPYRNFIYIDDLLDAWETVIDNPLKVQNNTYTLGPNNAVKISAYADQIAELMGWKGVINWDTKPARPGEIYVLNSSNTLLTEHTGWEPKVSLEEGLKRTIAHWSAKKPLSWRGKQKPYPRGH